MISRTRLLCALALAALATALAPAAAAADDLRVSSSGPDFVTPGGYALTFLNVHSVSESTLNGNLAIDITLPPGLSFAAVENFTAGTPDCVTSGQETECVTDVTGTPKYRVLGYKLFFAVEPGASGILNGQIEVSGAGTGAEVTVPISMTVGPVARSRSKLSRSMPRMGTGTRRRPREPFRPPSTPASNCSPNRSPSSTFRPRF